MGICKFGVLHRAAKHIWFKGKFTRRSKINKFSTKIFALLRFLYELHITSMKFVELLARPDALSFQNAIHFDAPIRAKAIFVFMTSIYSVCTWRRDKGFILIRHKRYQVYSYLQLSSSIASFVWEPAHFEFRSYGGAWHNAKIFGHFRSLSIRKSAFVNIFGSV